MWEEMVIAGNIFYHRHSTQGDPFPTPYCVITLHVFQGSNMLYEYLRTQPFAGMWILGFKSIKPAEVNVLQYVNIVKSYLINIKNYMNTFENRQYINYIISLRKTMELPRKIGMAAEKKTMMVGRRNASNVQSYYMF